MNKKKSCQGEKKNPVKIIKDDDGTDELFKRLTEKKWLPALIIVITALAAFGSTIGGEFVWDDEYVVKKNLFIRDLSNIPDLFTTEYFAPAEIGHYTKSGELSYRPAVTFTHFIDYFIFGLNPHGYHLNNLLLHISACLCLYGFLRTLGLSLRSSLIASMLFAVHPVNSETINTIAYREDILTGIFVCLAFIFYLKQKPLTSGLFYGLGLLSKEMTLAFLPLVLLHFLLVKPYKLYEDKTRFHFFVFLSLVITTGYLALIFGVFPSYSVDDDASTQSVGFPTMIRVIIHYMRLFVFPLGLTVDYLFPVSPSVADPKFILSLILLAAALAIPLFLKWRHVTKFLYFWFFAALLPVSGIYPLANFIAERYLYLPSMGWCGAAGIAAASVVRLSGKKRKRTAFAVAGVLLVFIFYNNGRNRIWSDEQLFYEAMIRANNYSHKGWSGLGLTMMQKQEYEKAVTALKNSLVLNEKNAIALHNLGSAYMELAKNDEAIQTFRKVIELDPDFIESRYHLGLMLRKQEKKREAEEEFKQVLAQNPNFIPARFMLGVTLQERAEYEEAVEVYKGILELNPHYAKALKNLGVIYLSHIENPEKAAYYFRKYMQLAPDDPQRAVIQQAIKAAESYQADN